MLETGINSIGLLRFIVQFFAAVSGALALWGFVFSYMNKEEISKSIAKIYTFTLLFFIISWFTTYFLYFSAVVWAHEGVFIESLLNYIKNGFDLNLWVILGLSLFNIFFLSGKKYTKPKAIFFLVNFIGFLFITALTSWNGHFNTEQIFFSLHNIHSIFTLGTVITVDILYLFTLRKNNDQVLSIYKMFPAMSAVIWTGLGLDFLSVLLVFPSALILSPQFYFSQTLVAILILNGSLLSIRITDWLKRGFRSELIHLSGSISLASWISITFVDFFRLNISYVALLSYYVIIIIVAFLGHKVIFKYISNKTIKI